MKKSTHIWEKLIIIILLWKPLDLENEVDNKRYRIMLLFVWYLIYIYEVVDSLEPNLNGTQIK